MKNIVYATTNPGKFAEVTKLFSAQGIEIESPEKYGVNIDVEETGKTLEENAILKAESFRDAIGKPIIVMGDDTGLQIDTLGGEPGIHVRRWKGYKMTDQEIIDYCLLRMKDVPVGERQAHFRTVIAVAQRGLKTKLFSGTLGGEIVTEPIAQRTVGFPFESLFYVPQWRAVIGDVYKLPAARRAEFQTHRHQAVLAARPYLDQLTDRA